MKHFNSSGICFAIVITLTVIMISPVMGQSTSDDPTQDSRYKDETTSLILGIVIPGGGHFYSGETGTGAILLGTAILAPVISSAVAVNEVSDPSGGSTDKAIGALYVGLAVSVAAWIYSIADSQKAARRTNAKNGLVFMDKIQVSPTMVTTNTNQHGYGMTMRINF
jgi:hypothetical protein